MKCKYPQTKYIDGIEIQHRCGQCIPCIINRRQEWTGRILMESYMHPSSFFLTLTYASWWYPIQGVCPDELQRFIKRLRKTVGKFRYFAIGEYGDESARPHYHVVIYGNDDIIRYYEAARESWRFGHIDIRTLIKERASYIAGYAAKKYSKTKQVPDGYNDEFSRMSRKPGIGLPFISKFVKALGKTNVSLVYDDESDTKEVTKIRIGARIYPLDGYMRRAIRKNFGVYERSRKDILRNHLESRKEVYEREDVKEQKKKDLDTKVRKYLKMKKRNQI
jgi:hypothetical protein